MSERRASVLRRLTLAIWCVLILSIACWPLGGGIGWITTALASVPLLLPVPGIIRGRRRTLGWAPLAMAPALALALTEITVNAAARNRATISLGLILLAFASVLAALRSAARD